MRADDAQVVEVERSIVQQLPIVRRLGEPDDGIEALAAPVVLRGELGATV
ncbi:MAG: hypothetical protein ACRDHK_14390 [Actinomycetota bacterium]